MKNQSKQGRVFGAILVLFAFALPAPLSHPTYAMTIGHSENPSVTSKKTGSTGKRKNKPIFFIAWHGNRLITTSGVFLITPSIKLLDLAGSRYFEKDFKGPAPTVQLTLKGRKLIKVVIK